jgi:hypothetical protein
MARTSSSLATAASRRPCDSLNMFSLQDSERGCSSDRGDPRHAFQQQEEDHPGTGDMGSYFPPCCDNAMALNPSRWHMILENDQSPHTSHACHLKRSTNISNPAFQRKATSHNRWGNTGSDPKEPENSIQRVKTERTRCSQRLNWPSRKASGYSASRTPEASATNVTQKTDVFPIPVPTVIVVPKRHPRIRASSLVTGSERYVRRRYFDMIPTLPQRRQSNTSIEMSCDFSSSSL